MPKIIKFYNSGNEFIDIPQSSKKFIPEWYKEAKRFFPDNRLNFTQGHPNLALKMCTPFLDGITSGYIATTYCDILVTKTDLGLKLDWRSTDTIPTPVSERPKIVAETLPIPEGHSDQHFAWHNIFQIKLPKGYSCFIGHPLNRFDLPFTTLSAIVDADYGMQQGNVPFFIKSNFEGVIPCGTPMFQIIPFKRENWKSEKDISLKDLDKKHEFLNLRTMHGYYKNKFWNRKSYD